jgi:hypothetical protein
MRTFSRTDIWRQFNLWHIYERIKGTFAAFHVMNNTSTSKSQVNFESFQFSLLLLDLLLYFGILFKTNTQNIMKMNANNQTELKQEESIKT